MFPKLIYTYIAIAILQNWYMHNTGMLYNVYTVGNKTNGTHAVDHKANGIIKFVVYTHCMNTRTLIM
jgi:hypothetical protein